MNWKYGWALTLLLLLCGCGSQKPAAEAESEAQVFEVKGRIVGIPADRETLTIDHEEIPGFMPAMTMPFYLKEPALADGLMAGQAIRFTYVVEERRSWIENIQKIDADELALDSENGFRPQRQTLRIPRLKEGDTVPGFQLVNQEGETFLMSDLYGDLLVLTFIFTRCPVPDFCPKMSHQFEEIQEEAKASEALRNRFHLLSVTIDPEYDSPEILAQYARQYTDDLSTWTFATGSPDRIDEMTTRFALFMEDNAETGTIDHALVTALIGPDGTLLQVWRGNAWEPEEVLAAMRQAADEVEGQE